MKVAFFLGLFGNYAYLCIVQWNEGLRESSSFYFK